MEVANPSRFVDSQMPDNVGRANKANGEKKGVEANYGLSPYRKIGK